MCRDLPLHVVPSIRVLDVCRPAPNKAGQEGRYSSFVQDSRKGHTPQPPHTTGSVFFLEEEKTATHRHLPVSSRRNVVQSSFLGGTLIDIRNDLNPGSQTQSPKRLPFRRVSLVIIANGHANGPSFESKVYLFLARVLTKLNSPLKLPIVSDFRGIFVPRGWNTFTMLKYFRGGVRRFSRGCWRGDAQRRALSDPLPGPIRENWRRARDGR